MLMCSFCFHESKVPVDCDSLNTTDIVVCGSLFRAYEADCLNYDSRIWWSIHSHVHTSMSRRPAMHDSGSATRVRCSYSTDCLNS